MATLDFILRDPDTGVGLPNQAVTLRIGPSFNTTTHTLADVSGKPGAYKLDDLSTFQAAEYELWVNGAKDDSFGRRELFQMTHILMKSGGTMSGAIAMGGNPITGLPDPTGNDEPETKGRVSTFLTAVYTAISDAIGTALLKAGGTMTGNINMGGKSIENVSDTVSAQGLVNYQTNNTIYTRKRAGITENIAAQYNFTTVPRLTGTPPERYTLNDMISHKVMRDFCQAILSGVVAGDINAYQQNENLIRVIFSGVQEDNKVYQVLEAAIDVAEGYASASRRMTILIEAEYNDTDVLTNYNLIPVTFAPYISIVCLSRIRLVVAEDTYINDFTNPIIGGIIDNENASAATTFEDMPFIGVHFTNLDGTGSYNFVNCILEHCTYDGDKCTVTTDADCVGELTDIDNLMRYLEGSLDVSGTIEGRMLGRAGANVASANTIIVNDGNGAFVTGTTDVEFIDAEDWTPYSFLTLEFDGPLDVIHGSIPTGTAAGIVLKGGITDTVSAEFKRFQLNKDKTYWIEY